jgi:hypothetical protein
MATPKAKTTKKKVDAKKSTRTPVHQWTDGGDEVLILRYSDQSGKSYDDFQHPMEISESVKPESWNPKPFCGGGIHGWAWGIGLGEGKEPDWYALWQVYGAKPEDVVGEIDGGIKCKFKTGILRHKGDWHSAMMFILDGQKRWVEHFSEGNGHATGDRSASSATGDRSASSATGDRSASSATGDRSASSALGKASAAIVTGAYGKAQAGKYGCIALAWWNEKEDRFEMRCREVGCGDGSDGKLKAGVWYRLNDGGGFEECN